MDDNVKAASYEITVTERNGGIDQVYANHITGGFTSHDVELRFSYHRRLPDLLPSSKPTVNIEQRTNVTMAWTEAKALRDLLSTLISQYEKLNGEINQPKIPS